MKCPNCGLLNPDSAERCDCGYDFASRLMKESYLRKSMEEPKQTKLKTRRDVPLVIGAIQMVIGIFFVTYFEGWWTYLVAAFFILTGWAALKTGLFGSDKEIKELTEDGHVSEETEHRFMERLGVNKANPDMSMQPNVVASQNVLKEPEAKPVIKPEAKPAVSSKTFNIGDRIGKRFEIYKILGGEGKSGMGAIYVCYDHKFKGVLALKTFQDKYLSSKEMKDSFKEEALAWIHLESHPYIVRAIWVEELDHRMFVVCEFIAPDEHGRNTLTHYLRSPISLEQALIWSIQFCYGMEHAYSKGVSPHRDIKPDNIMITSEGTLKVTDFGLARLWDETGITGNMGDMNEEREGLTFIKTKKGRFICGTLPWMAPEQFDGIADVRSDIYSFGIVMYQMTHGGKLPFYPQNRDDWEIVHKNYVPMLVDSLLSLRAEGEAISRFFSLIVIKCLKKRTKERYRDFNELREELTELYRDAAGKEPLPLPDKIQLGAWELIGKGFSLFNLGLFDEAIKAYKEALRIDPEDAYAYSKLGNALKAKGEIDEAIKAYKEALRIDPEDACAYNNLGVALCNKGNFEEAIIAYREAIRINPEDVYTHNNLGLALYNKGHFDEAIKSYKEAIRIDPEYSEAYHKLGYALKAKGEIDEAIKAYKEALRIDPEDAYAYNNLGVALCNKGNFEEAIIAYREAIRINPEDVYTHNNLGLALYNKGHFDEAIKSYKEAIRIDPEDAYAYNNLGVTLAKKGQFDEAIKTYKEAIKINPENAHVYFDLGYALYVKGHLDDAIKAYKEAIRVNPEHGDAYNNLGYAFEDKGQFDDAIKAYRVAIRINPMDSVAHLNIGNVFYNKGLMDDAIKAYKEAKRINSEYVEAYNNLGLVLKDKGQLDEAIKEYKEAIRINHKHADTYHNLGYALQDKGQINEAINAFKNFIRLAPPQYARQVEKVKEVIKQLKGEI